MEVIHSEGGVLWTDVFRTVVRHLLLVRLAETVGVDGAAAGEASALPGRHVAIEWVSPNATRDRRSIYGADDSVRANQALLVKHRQLLLVDHLAIDVVLLHAVVVRRWLAHI